VLIGDGIPLFGRVPADIRLRLRAAHASDGGMVHVTYDVVQGFQLPRQRDAAIGR
jgi:hypothetical protein